MQSCLSQFQEGLTSLEQVRSSRWVRFDAVQAQWLECLQKEWRQRTGKKCNPKWTEAEILKRLKLSDAEYVALIKPFKDEIDRIYTDTSESTKRFEQELQGLAEKILLPLCSEYPQWTKYHCIGTYAYATQGFGAETYARAEAERHAAHAQRHGLTTMVTRYAHPAPRGGYHWSQTPTVDFVVWIEGGSLDAEVLQRKPQMSLREWVKDCWQRGCNPRVFNPWLPHDLEARLRIDYQGRDLTPEV